VNDDAQLISETLSGQAAAFGQLVQRYQDRLYNSLVHIMGDTHEARDMVQEAFVQAYLKLGTFQQTSTFYTWLYRIAFNVAASHARRRRPAVSVEQAREATGQEPVDDSAGPSQQLEQLERANQVRKALATLSEEHRLILVLREIDGFCYEAIAEMLDLPLGTVRSRLHRARSQLRDQLKELLTVDEL
jgi:RNA polymerase sigma-70 factor (ECF subfamily)